MQKNKKKQWYSYDLRKQVVEMYLEGHAASDLVERFNLSNSRNIYDWVKKAREGGFKALEDHRGLHNKEKAKINELSIEEKYERLKLENEYLKKLLDLKRG